MSTELPFHLKKLEGVRGALDIIRLLGSEPESAADVDWICESLDMSDRRFGKAIRRLATTGYVQMNADSDYLLTDKGVNAASELVEFDQTAPSIDTSISDHKIQRHLVVALPHQLRAGRTADMLIGFAHDPDNRLASPANIVLRVTTTHALMGGTGDEMLTLDNSVFQQSLQITPERYSQIRVKVQVFQLAPNGEDITNCGGLFVDVDVSGDGDETGLVAYGTTIQLDPI